MQVLPSLVGGIDQRHERWVHVVKDRAMMSDPIGTLILKLELEDGSADLDDERILGKVGITTPDHVAKALDDARDASTTWRGVPLHVRSAFAEACAAEIERRTPELIEILVQEGRTRYLANAEVDRALGEALLGSRWHGGVVHLQHSDEAAPRSPLRGLPALIGGSALVVNVPPSAPVAIAWFWREIVWPIGVRFGAPSGTLSVICSPRHVVDILLGSQDARIQTQAGRDLQSQRGSRTSSLV